MFGKESQSCKILPIRPEVISIPRRLELSVRDTKGLWYPYENKSRPTDWAIVEACFHARDLETYGIVRSYGDCTARSLVEEKLIQKLESMGVDESLAYTVVVDLDYLSFFDHVSFVPFLSAGAYIGIVRKYPSPQPEDVPYEILVLPCKQHL